jgi:arabinan endo-1,5-alpha-L-arabinosidase
MSLRARVRRPVRTRALLVLPLLAALGFPVTAPAAAAGNGGPQAKTYENPILPQIPGDGVVESCADPTVFRGQESTTPVVWYMFCTTDPLNDEDRNAEGGFNFHKIPMFTSTDLVNWTYVGDAFTENPAVADPGAGLWAPEVAYSSTYDKYYLFFGVTDTADAYSPEPGCHGDNSIAVATSDNPTGPWTTSTTLVVEPRSNGGTCNYLWTFDPDVLGDVVGTSSVLYYGSYYGGIEARSIAFTATGATTPAGSGTDIAVWDRYEGANVIKRGEYYYLFVSATNCCNSELTGYSVFVGRSTSPFGPFVDQQGNSFLDERVGGTPFLSMNGNRWMGPGHNTVFQDFAGQWWTMYHAVDRTDANFAGTTNFTKRPAMLDPIDWINGWPTVRGGQWASDQKMPAPAAQPGQRTRYRTKLARQDRLGKLLYAEEFNTADALSDWTWEGDAPDSPFNVSGGSFNWETEDGDLHTGSNSAAVLTHAAPKGDYVVEAKVRLNVPADGCCFNYTQAGISIFDDEDNFVKLVHFSLWGTRQTEFAKEYVNDAGEVRYGNTVVGTPSEWTWFRIVVERIKNPDRVDGDTHLFTPYTSQDGVTWVKGGSYTHDMGTDARIGLLSMAEIQDGEWTANFDYVRVYRHHSDARNRAGR